MSVGKWNWAPKIAIGVGAIATILYLYKSLKKAEEPEHRNNLPKQIENLKERINVNEPTVQDLKDIMTVSTDLSFKAIERFNQKFRTDRRRYFKVDFSKYLRVLADGIVELEHLDKTTHQQTLDMLGMSDQQYEQACFKHTEIHDFSPVVKKKSVPRHLNLEQIKQVFQFQKQYLQKHNVELQQKIKSITGMMGQSAQGMFHSFISYILADLIFSQYKFEEEQVEQAIGRYCEYLKDDMAAVRMILLPMIKRSQSTASVSKSNNHLDDVNDSEMDNESLMRLNPRLQQMQNMEGDPEIMQQLMAMMHNK